MIVIKWLFKECVWVTGNDYLEVVFLRGNEIRIQEIKKLGHCTLQIDNKQLCWFLSVSTAHFHGLVYILSPNPPHPLHFKLFGKTTTFILLVNNFFLDLNKSSTCRLPRTVYSLALMTSHVSDFTATIRPVSLQGQIVPEYVLPFCRHAQRYTFNFVQTNSYQYAFFTVSNRSLSTTTL